MTADTAQSKVFICTLASSSDLSLCPVESANKSLSTCNYGGKLRPSCGGHSRSNRTAIAVNFRGQQADDNFVLEWVCRYVSRLLLGHSFGVFPAPGGTRSSASHFAPLWGLGSSQNKFENHGKERPKTSFWEGPERSLRGAFCRGSQTCFGRNRDPEGARNAKQKTECRRAQERPRSCDRAKDGIHNGRHAPEQSSHLHIGCGSLPQSQCDSSRHVRSKKDVIRHRRCVTKGPR